MEFLYTVGQPVFWGWWWHLGQGRVFIKFWNLLKGQPQGWRDLILLSAATLRLSLSRHDQFLAKWFPEFHSLLLRIYFSVSSIQAFLGPFWYKHPFNTCLVSWLVCRCYPTTDSWLHRGYWSPSKETPIHPCPQVIHVTSFLTVFVVWKRMSSSCVLWIDAWFLLLEVASSFLLYLQLVCISPFFCMC